ncbi:MAG: GDSL-type esterase/lipase family protein [Deltaproteobacteria bacterium]|nr:GDSL-type esterase/lipase family protein [Deltaproteobacteria bacterium]
MARSGAPPRLAAIAALNLIGLLAALLLGEAAVRLLRLGPLPLTVFEPHPRRMFTLSPGKEALFVGEEFATEVRIGPDGLRHPALLPAEEAPQPRILALGDSFTFGYGVEAEESWPARLEARLRATGFPVAEVINAGVVAYAPDQELDLLRELLPRVRPDLVIVGLYIGNDPAEVLLHRSAPPMQVSPEGALLENPTDGDLHPGFVRGWLAAHSRLYALARVRSHRLLVALGLREAPAHFHAGYFLDALGYTDAYSENWSVLEGIVTEMARESRSAGAKFLLAVIPMDVQVSDRYWKHYRRLGFTLLPALLSDDLPQARVRAFAARAGIMTLDLLPVLRAHRDGPLLFSRNPHWTPAGQEEAATALAPAVRILLSTE